MSDNIRQIPNPEQDKILAGLAQMERMLPHLAQYTKLTAQLKRTQYLAYIEAGFDQAQALELCKVPGV